MIPEPLTSLANHLWQSTLFAGAIGLLALLLKRNRAAIRYGLWLTASVKFLLPFSLLVALGHQLEWPAESVDAPTVLVSAVEGVGYPFAAWSESTAVPVVSQSRMQHAETTGRLWILLLLVWLSGAAFVGLRWLRESRRLRLSLEYATPLELNIPIRALATSSPVEPGVVGVVRPVLILPKGLMERLTPAQVDAVLAHEMCHVRRRDNLAAALHMIVESVFWFHPLVWWIERRLVDERERACDEEVLKRGSEPQAYAEGILNVCRFYKESPLVCVSGVTGSNLKKRIEDIMRNRIALQLGFSKSMMLALVAVVVLAGPVAMGVVGATAKRAQSPPVAQSTTPVTVPFDDIVFVGGDTQGVLNTEYRIPWLQAAVQGPPAATQTSPAPRETFEVASIRRTRFAAGGERGQGGGGASSIRPAGEPCGDHPHSFFLKFDPGRAEISDMTAYGLIAWAYSLNCPPWKGSFLLFGGPGWMKSEGWDIQANIPPGAPAFASASQNAPGAPPERQTMEPRFRKMLQSLLEDRFKLVIRRETRQVPVYSLSIANGGLKLKTWKAGEDPETFEAWDAKLGLPSEGERYRQARALGQQDRGWIIGLKAPWDVFMSQIRNGIDRPIVDRTGIMTGDFIYRFAYSRLLPPQSPVLGPADVTTPSAPSLFTALEDELGLKLEATTAPMEVWVIDRLERPSEN